MTVRIARYAKREPPTQSTRVADCDRLLRLYSRPWYIGLLGVRYPLASFFSIMDVRRYNCARPTWESLGTFHWNLCRWPVGLFNCSCEYLLFQWAATAFSRAHTGHLERPDLVIAVPAWFASLIVVIGCAWAYCRLPKKSLSDLSRLLVDFVLTTGFFALDMALFQPRYLAVFPRMLHPRMP